MLISVTTSTCSKVVGTVRRKFIRHASTSHLPSPKLDLRSIVDNADRKARNLQDRNAAAHLPPDLMKTIQQLYHSHKSSAASLGKLRQERTSITATIAKAKLNSESVSQETRSRAVELKGTIHLLQEETERLSDELQALAQLFPNDTHPDTPNGPAQCARILKQWDGARRVIPPDTRRDHLTIVREMHLVDFEAGAKVTGSSWTYLLNEAALLEQALVSFALSVAINHGYQIISAPDVVRSDFALRCGYQPKEDRSAQLHSYSLGPTNPDLVLSGTAEIPLAGMNANSILNLSHGPIRRVCSGKAFRVEAGARGRESKGLYRLHEFSKVELYVISDQDTSENLMEEMLRVQTLIIQSLGLPYRVLDMPTEELGASAYRKYDIEVWMPGRGAWGEVASLSNCTDYQSRRLHLRYRDHTASADTTIEYCHTLNGTAAAIPRLLLALLENGVRFDGPQIQSLELPTALKPFWLGSDFISQRKEIPIVWV